MRVLVYRQEVELSSDWNGFASRTWLDSWSSIGQVAVGMARQGFDLQLTRYDAPQLA